MEFSSFEQKILVFHSTTLQNTRIWKISRWGLEKIPFPNIQKFLKKILDIFVLNLYYFSQSNLWKDRLMSVVLVVQNGSVFSTSQRFAQICRIRSHCGPLSPW